MSGGVLRASAFAKVNLSLAVTGVRADGMHTLRTVMQTVSLCDTIEVERAEELTFACSSPSLAGSDNLCVRAAKAFYGASGLAEGAAIRLEKRIPTGAGLGGGSADAATVLRLLNRLHGFPLAEEALFPLAEKLGADVPFCLYGGKCLCTGIGEQLVPLPDGEARALVIAKGQGSLSTPEMYRRLDAQGLGESAAQNAFEPVAAELLPEIGVLKHALTAVGGTEVCMTGSGSAMFGFFPSIQAAEAAAAELRKAQGCFAAACRTVSHAESTAILMPGD